MKDLTIDYIREFVRSRIDELAAEDSDMMEIVSDSRNLDRTIDSMVCEAANDIHVMAPLSMMEGLSLTYEYTADKVVDKIVDIDLKEKKDKSGNDIHVQRLLSLKHATSPVTIHGAFFENEPIAKLQLNKYMRGTAKSPVLVELLTSDVIEMQPHYKYYTTSFDNTPESENNKFEIIYAPHQDTFYKNTEGKDCIFVASKAVEGFLNYLTGLVLTVYLNSEQAKVFLTKAKADLGVIDE